MNSRHSPVLQVVNRNLPRSRAHKVPKGWSLQLYLLAVISPAILIGCEINTGCNNIDGVCI